MRKTILLVLATFFIGTTSIAQKKNVNTEPYPFNNPVIKHMYTADAAPHVMPDGKVWMVTSVDHEYGGGYSTMHKYHTFSSSDMVNWVDHGEVLNVWDVLESSREPEGEDWALWAPDMIYLNGKYYLYFPVRKLFKSHGYEEKKRKTEAYIGVAVSDAPDKPFKVLSKKIEGTHGIDPAVFIDDDGQPYLYFGSHWGAKLKDNMIELDGEPVKMKVDDKDFMEAIWMNKRNNKYYVSYHKHYDKPIDPEKPDDPDRRKSRIDYGISDSPLGPFKYSGILNYELGVNVEEGPKLPGKSYVPWRLYQSNHGGIVEYHGKEYLFYHTSALSSWRQDAFKGPGTWTQRSVCIDEIKYNSDGSIVTVQQTLKGVSPVKVNQPYKIILEVRDAITKDIKTKGLIYEVKKKNASLKFNDVDLGSGYYYLGMEVLFAESPCKVEIRLDRPDGKLVGTINLDKNSPVTNNAKAETFLRDAKGRHDIYVVFKSEKEPENLMVKNIMFFAGCPGL